MKINKQWIVGVMMLALAGCYYDSEEELYPTPPPTNIPDTTVVSYAATIAPMMATNCTTSGCHNGTQSPNLTTYQGVFNNQGVVKSRAVNGTPTWMPAAGPMSLENRNNLEKWIDAGAPNN